MGMLSKSVNVNGVDYTLTTLPGTTGSDALSKLLGMIGDPGGAMLGLIPAGMKAGDVSLLDSEVNKEALGNVLGKMGREIAKPGCVDLIKTLLSSLTKKEGQMLAAPVNYDMEFAANYGTLSQLVMFALELNYTSFFSGNPALGALLRVALSSNRT